MRKLLKMLKFLCIFVMLIFIIVAIYEGLFRHFLPELPAIPDPFEPKYCEKRYHPKQVKFSSGEERLLHLIIDKIIKTNFEYIYLGGDESKLEKNKLLYTPQGYKHAMNILAREKNHNFTDKCSLSDERTRVEKIEFSKPRKYKEVKELEIIAKVYYSPNSSYICETGEAGSIPYYYIFFFDESYKIALFDFHRLGCVEALEDMMIDRLKGG